MDIVPDTLKKLFLCQKKTKLFFFFLILPLGVCAQPEQVAIQLLDITNQREPVINIINLKIDQLWHSGRYEKIFPLFHLVVRLDPLDEEAWATGGWFLIYCVAPMTGFPESEKIKQKGIEFLKEGLTHNFDSYRLYWELAWIYYARGEFGNAVAYLDKAIQYEHPAYVENTRAHALEKLGRIDEAIKQWQEIRKKFPEMRFVAERFILNLQKEKTDVKQNP